MVEKYCFLCKCRQKQQNLRRGKKLLTDGKTAKITEGEKVGRLAAWAWLAIGLAGWLAGLADGLGGNAEPNLA